MTPSYFGTVANPSVLSLDLWANFNTIGVRLYYTEHSSLAGTAVEATLSVLVGGQWIDAHDFVKDVDQQMLVSKIFGLSEGQSYTVRVSFIRRDANAAILEQHILFGTTTTQLTPTSGSGGQIWIAPNGNDANPGTYLFPKRTLAAAAAALPIGGYLMLKDGDYFFDQSAHEHEINNVSGTPGQYYTLMAEHAGGARILGYQAVNGVWNASGNGIYWIDAPQLYDTTIHGQFGPNNLVDVTTGRLLYTYRSLTTDNPSQFVYAMNQHPEAGWFYDFTTRRLYVKLESGAAPPLGQAAGQRYDFGRRVRQFVLLDRGRHPFRAVRPDDSRSRRQLLPLLPFKRRQHPLQRPRRRSQ